MEIEFEKITEEDFIYFKKNKNKLYLKYNPETLNNQGLINEIIINFEKFKNNVNYKTSDQFGIFDFLEEEKNGVFEFVANDYIFFEEE